MLPALIIISVLLAAAVFVVAWLLSERASLRREKQRLEADLFEAEQIAAGARAEMDDARHRVAAAQQDLAVAEQKIASLTEQFAAAQQQARETFKSLAGDVLKESTEQFLKIAGDRLKSEQDKAGAALEAREKAIDNLVNPIRDSLEKYNLSMQQIEQTRKQAYGGLTEQLRELTRSQEVLRNETTRLVQALRHPQARGRWGEMQLRRVAELAGMIEHCDFAEQESIATDAGGSIRPDMVVRLPSERCVVVDAKTPLDAFLQATEAATEAERERHYERHTQQIEAHVRTLAGKEYGQQLETSPDFVVLFIPGESFLFPAVQRKPELIESAMRRGVVIATPTTLISLLKVIALGWREQRIAENAQRIRQIGEELHERLRVLTEHLGDLGRSLHNAVTTYNRFVGSFERRVMVSARRFEELGAASGKKLPEEVGEVSNVPREIDAAVIEDETNEAQPQIEVKPIDVPTATSLWKDD